MRQQPHMHIMIVSNILELQVQLLAIKVDPVARQDVVVSAELLYKKLVHCFFPRILAVL
jgi:hypothetical protein